MPSVTKVSTFLSALISVIILSGCSNSNPPSASNQLDYACAIVNNWPVDYATIWPLAVKNHNKSPELLSAGDYMKEYIDLESSLFEIDDQVAADIIDRYKNYWTLLELDLIRGGGMMPDDPISSGTVPDLMTYCDENGRGFND